MNNFFERAIALQNQYYEEELDLRKRHYEILPEPCFLEPFEPCKVTKIEILSQLVATYVAYGGRFPTKFTLKISHSFYISYLSELLKEISTDLEIEGEFTIPIEFQESHYLYNILFIR